MWEGRERGEAFPSLAYIIKSSDAKDAENISEGKEEYMSAYNVKLLDLMKEGKTEQEAKSVVIAEIRDDYKEYNIDRDRLEYRYG